ncbi:RRP12-like protein [Clavelina lepadiformis]|uniref:RRP12-like protein n=1 Tax=Clavelina lepadiformis TaxID=159417 RepID=UPI0040413B4D
MGKPGKLRSGLHTKTKKWAKGGSSASNPELHTHRDKAQTRFFHMQPTLKSNKGLTTEALKIHNEMANDKTVSTIMDGTDNESVGTFGTFLSGLSDCTNATFGKIQRYWLNNSAKHKEVCAVLAAITEVIRGEGGTESDTAYFAALVTALSSVEQVESAAAVAYLLSMTCKNVPVPVLRAKFSEVSKLLCDILKENSGSAASVPTALVRSVMSCLGTILRQQNISIWQDSSATNIFHTMLSFVIHSKPKIRKAAQNAVCSVICASGFVINSEDNLVVHPASATTAKFCIAQLEKFGGISADAAVCHILSLLGRILHCFPQVALKRSCETVLRLMTLSDPVVKSVCLQTLYSMFVSKPDLTVLPPGLNAQIIGALYDYHPSSSDAQACSAWLSVMEKALQNLSVSYLGSAGEKEAKTLAVAHIPKLMNTCFKLMLSQSMKVANVASNTVKVLLRDCASTFWAVDQESCTEEKKFVSIIFQIFDDGLKYKFHSIWNLVFEIVEIAFKCIVKPAHANIVKPILINIVDLRNAPQFQYKTELDNAVGAAIGKLGPKSVLEAAPLQIDGTENDYSFCRSWLLPVMKNSISHANLSFFSEYFLPLAVKLRLKAQELKASGHQVETKTYETLQFQCWDLCPVFCKDARDISVAFPAVARILGRALNEHMDLRLIVMQALRNIVISCRESEKDCQVVARFAKNYIPILFNLYANVELSNNADDVKQTIVDANKNKSLERLAALETIKIYLRVTDCELISTYFLKAKQRVFEGDNENDATRLALLDLMISMVTYVKKDQINDLYKAMIPMLNSPNHSMQKKAYRLLEEICGFQEGACKEFVASHLSELKLLLLSGLTSASASSKGPRIKCILQVFKQLHSNPDTVQESLEFLTVSVPEVILCTKSSKKSRLAAFGFLVDVGQEFINAFNEQNPNESMQAVLKDYFEIVSTGLAGFPMMIQATIVALSRLIYEFKDQLSSDLMDSTISNICLLLGCNTREVCKAALGFVMVLFTILPRATLAQYTKQILDALLNWKPETRRHFRFRVKKILQRLVRKFGFDTIYSMTPEEHRKQLQNIRKVDERKKRASEKQKELPNDVYDDDDTFSKKKKKESIEEILADSSDSDEDADKHIAKTNKKPKVKSAWLQDEQEEPMNLLDPSVSQKVMSTNPKCLTEKKDAPFKTAPDGRFIIGGDESDIEDDDDDAETKKILIELGVGKQKSFGQKVVSVKGKKRRNSASEEDKDEELGGKRPSYQPGGKGIHRNLNSEEAGEKFKSKAGGDAKRKGTHEPYAFLPFNTGVLNKRKRKKLSGQFDGLIKAARKGAAAGKKKKFINDRQRRK